MWAAVAVQACCRYMQQQVRRCLLRAQTRAETSGCRPPLIGRPLKACQGQLHRDVDSLLAQTGTAVICKLKQVGRGGTYSNRSDSLGFV